MKNNKVNLAVIGLGNMGIPHARDIQMIDNAKLFAVCDIKKERADNIADQYGIKAYYNYYDLLMDHDIDAIIIATPHYDHTPISIAALKKGIHVLTEKPIAVHAKDAQKMIDAYTMAATDFPNLTFAAMFQQRTLGYWKKIKELIDTNELGKLVRTTWIITKWFRTQTYYDNGTWRATWNGEGGGVLLNQCPHNLDLYQWIVGLPNKVSGFVKIGKYHNIEVEDEVTGYFEHENGMIGHFITTTAESPGTDRLEIIGEKGKLVCENNQIIFFRNRESMLETIKTSDKAFDKVENWKIEIPFVDDNEHPHRQIIQNFVNTIQQKASLIAPAVEGIKSVSLGNAILFSALKAQPISLPFDADAYEALLFDLIKQSDFKKRQGNEEIANITNSFH
ncbi:MAG: Gfo/Idh/MocA family oxidoreductase [Anaerolineaceae bacterium]|nr:Gfo/Idh/MocA family oxidoreductase [Anaerolineaceae bacterium]